VPELEQYGASLRTMRQFLGAYADLQVEVRDVLVPNPDRKAARP
jgi:transaldolase